MLPPPGPEAPRAYRLSVAPAQEAARPNPEGGRPVGARPVSVGARTRVEATAVTLDLWYTLLWFRPEDRAGWRDARLRLISRALGDARGRPVSERAVSRTIGAEVRRLAREGSKISRLDPAELLGRLAERLGPPPRASLAAWAKDLSEAGLASRPPNVNPEARAFLAALHRRRIPVAVVTNSARRPSTWADFLRRQRVGPIADVITSSAWGYGKPDPRIFRRAARTLGTAPARLVHIGDCWHADVEGARQVGATAVWYRGLFGRYPDPGQAEFERDADDGDPAVWRVDRFPDVVRR